MIKQECIGIPDMILLLMIFCFKKIKIKAEIVLSPGGAYFVQMKILTPNSVLYKIYDHTKNYTKSTICYTNYMLYEDAIII